MHGLIMYGLKCTLIYCIPMDANAMLKTLVAVQHVIK